MTPSKFGIQLSCSLLATAVALAPVNGALAAAPPSGVEVSSPDDEGDEGEEIAVGGEDDEGEELSVGGEDDEGEELSVGGEGEEEEDEDEDEDEELPDAEEVADEPLDLTPLGPQRPAEPTWGVKKRPRDGKGMLITGGLVTGLGGGFIAAAILITRCDFDSALACRYGDQRDFLVPTAIATTGLGLLLVGVGIGNRIKYKRWENWAPEQTAVVPTYVPGGGGFAWVGRF